MITAISKPIIGADFLFHHGLMIDLKGRQLIDKETRLNFHFIRLMDIFQPSIHAIRVSH